MSSCLGREDSVKIQQEHYEMDALRSTVRKVEGAVQAHAERWNDTGKRLSKLESQMDQLNRDFRKMTVLGQSVAKLEGRLVTGEAQLAKVAKFEAELAKVSDQNTQGLDQSTQVKVDTLEQRLQGIEEELLESVRHVFELVSRENSRAVPQALPQSLTMAPGMVASSMSPGKNGLSSSPMQADPLADLEAKLNELSRGDIPEPDLYPEQTGDFFMPDDKLDTVQGYGNIEQGMPSKENNQSAQYELDKVPGNGLPNLEAERVPINLDDSRMQLDKSEENLLMPMPSPAEDATLPVPAPGPAEPRVSTRGPLPPQEPLDSVHEKLPDHLEHLAMNPDGIELDVEDEKPKKAETSPPPEVDTPGPQGTDGATPDSDKQTEALTEPKAGSKKSWRLLPKWLRR